MAVEINLFICYNFDKRRYKLKKGDINLTNILFDCPNIDDFYDNLKDFFDDETQETIIDDPLIKKICHLNKKQRTTLSAFLDAMNE